MKLFPFVGAAPLPRPAALDKVALGLARWREAAEQAGGAGLADFAAAAAADPTAGPLLAAMWGGSPFLVHCAVVDPAFVRHLLEDGPEAALATAMIGLAPIADAKAPHDETSRALRIAKRRVALTTAAADIAGLWSEARVTTALSDFADAALRCAVARLLADHAAAGAFRLPHPEAPERESGFIVLGMGKLGAHELNYSSDIDLMLLFDHERIATDDPDSLQTQFVRLSRSLVRLMDERTADGYVFRTDLRLRPDPGSTPPAMSVLAALTYYESTGQNWERAALIKARPVAGDIAAGEAFIKELRPFIWRKNLDFAAIQDIHSIKRQINAHRGGWSVAVGGHNIKLGRGGNREMEFFAQTHHHIWGGREPRLRGRSTVEALSALASMGRIAEKTAHEMTESYWFLRRVEHRLQMIDDKQTHTLPEDEGRLSHLALFLGYPDSAAFAGELLFHLRRVESHYVDLFEDAPALGAPGTVGGNLVFTGTEDDPDTLATIAALGFANPHGVAATVRGWHHGRYRATRSTRAKEILTELMPALLAALGRSTDPSSAFAKFDDFLAGLPAGVQVFSLFAANPGLLDLVAEIMGGAPRLAEHLSRHPGLLDNVLTADFFDPPPSATALAEELERTLADATHFEAALDAVRRWAHDRRFQVGVQMLRGRIAPRDAAAALTNVADVAVSHLLPVVEAEFALAHGRVPGGGMAVLAMGKMGGREMTSASDLDLIFVYDAPAEVESSDGRKSLPVSQYYGRLSQRFLNALTAPTGEGTLYEVDMRLRPSGNKGPIASRLVGFIQYQRESAWTWEHMALTRTRVLCGPPALTAAVEATVREVLTRPRAPDKLLADVAEMRERMEREHHSDFLWEVKHRRGGLVDIEFLAQYLQLRHAHDRPDILSTNTREALERLTSAGFLSPSVATDLIAALDLWQAVQGVLRLTIEGFFRPEREHEVSQGLQQALAAAAAVPDFATLKDRMAELGRTAYGHFAALVETPGTALRTRTTS
jgi:glutamate-ammonia-ligase adenylyltransferase